MTIGASGIIAKNIVSITATIEVDTCGLVVRGIGNALLDEGVFISLHRHKTPALMHSKGGDG